MGNIDLWFPTAIYHEDNLISEQENTALLAHCNNVNQTNPSGGLDWYGGTYTTHGSYELSKDTQLKNLIGVITDRVHKVAETHGCNGKYNNYSTWMNASVGNNWQEFHSHPNSIFSAVYYVASPLGSGNIVFEDPREPDMFPLKNPINKNTLSHTRIPYSAKTRGLIIFRSYLRHMVEPGKNTEKRISIALNFN